MLLVDAAAISSLLSAELPETMEKIREKLQIFRSLPWKIDKVSEPGLSIVPIRSSQWQDEAVRYVRPVYHVAYPSIVAVCWPDMKVCSNADEIFCDVETLGVPEVVDGRQVLAARVEKTEQCVMRKYAPQGGASMHDSVTYRWGVRR